MPTERVVTTEVIHKYIWPEGPLTVWFSLTWYFFTFQLGVFAAFMSVQNQLGLGQPWLFPFGVTIGALGTFYLLVITILRQYNKLLPNVVMLGSVILFCLELTCVIETGIMMFSSSGVNSQCSASSLAIDGVSVQSMAFLAQTTICNLWNAVFALKLVSLLFLVWIWIMAWQVSNDNYE